MQERPSRKLRVYEVATSGAETATLVNLMFSKKCNNSKERRKMPHESFMIYQFVNSRYPVEDVGYIFVYRDWVRHMRLRCRTVESRSVSPSPEGMDL